MNPNDVADSDGDDVADVDDVDLAMIVVTAHIKTVTATSKTNPKPASITAFRRPLGSGRWPVG